MDPVETGKRKRGRPPKPPEDRRGPNVTFRTPGGLRSRLEEAARTSGRAISEEVVHRLELSFENETIITALQRESANLRRTVEEVVKHAVKEGLGSIAVGRARTAEDIEAEKKLKEREKKAHAAKRRAKPVPTPDEIPE